MSRVGLLLSLLLPAVLCAEDADLQLVHWKAPQLQRLAVRIEVDGRIATAEWDEKFAALVAFFDRDGNGLNEEESRRLPSVNSLREVCNMGYAPPLGAAPAWKDLDQDGNGAASAAEVARVYRQAGTGVPQIGAGTMPFSADLTVAILQSLDTDADKNIDAKEWQTAATLVGKLDRDDDELVGAGELVPRILYPGIAGSTLILAPTTADARAEKLPSFPLLLLPANKQDDAWARIVLRARDKSDKTAEELLRWRESEPEQSCTIKLAADSSAPPQVSFHGKASATRTLIRADDGRLAKSIEQVKEHFTSLFERTDENTDKRVTETEIGEKTTDWRWLMPVADRDANKELSEEELTAWLALQKKLAAGQLMLTILDAGSGLFELLDTNHDGALSVPEFAAAAQVVDDAGCMVNGKFDASRIPPTLLITVSQGYPQSPLGKQERTGPAWFLAMDRNTDGVVSPREFSGTAEVFTKLDLDGSKFLSAEEAAKAGK